MRNIAVIMGGYSSEKDISIKSGNVIMENLDPKLFKGFPIIIEKNKWFLKDDAGNQEIDKNDFTVNLNGDKIVFDAVYNTIHGTPGEDGIFQAYLELLGIPQTSCDSYQAAVTFNKRDCIAVLKPWSIHTGKHLYLNQGEDISFDNIVEAVGLPCFVKANRSGSSFGVSKVYEVSAFAKALQTAFAVDDEIIIESFLDGMEVSIGVYQIGDTILSLPPTEIVSENDFFDYEAKYMGKAQEITPARLSESATLAVQELSKRIYSILKLKGLARADFIFHNGTPHFIEINTNPGMSRESIVPQQIKAAGKNLQEVLTAIIEDTILNHKK
ncbi:D-alanine-D-alanine ligase [Nonlabens sp. Hel1_33_55]|uniref:D-alanine--D-alanine ligase n=1 Tax=Nonlabens sp. Hel1_33_55 TaxID=1336802 RepID=UPI000875E78F|nr:D-alanine--D-alanine ligase [Nonlabens sp. Hel1_33_55]SCY22270.1 D-alanine-D-alanine ligase [Nonlabens sp. Hel1_33_55]